MARWSWLLDYEGLAGQGTMGQIGAGQYHDCRILAIEFMLRGTGLATRSLLFPLSLQPDTGVSSDDTTAVKRLPPDDGGTPTFGVRKNFVEEPDYHEIKYALTVHQVNSRLWIPAGGPVLVPAGLLMGLRQVSPFGAVPIRSQVYLED